MIYPISGGKEEDKLQEAQVTGCMVFYCRETMGNLPCCISADWAEEQTVLMMEKVLDK